MKTWQQTIAFNVIVPKKVSHVSVLSITMDNVIGGGVKMISCWPGLKA